MVSAEPVAITIKFPPSHDYLELGSDMWLPGDDGSLAGVLDPIAHETQTRYEVVGRRLVDRQVGADITEIALFVAAAAGGGASAKLGSMAIEGFVKKLKEWVADRGGEVHYGHDDGYR